MIDHQRCGYLARPFDNRDLANGIEWVLQESSKSDQLFRNARNKVVNTYELSLNARKHLALYEQII